MNRFFSTVQTAAGSVLRFFRRLIRIIKNRVFVQPAFLPQRNFGFYLYMIVFALIFTQALRSPISGVIFVFVLFLPLLSLLYLLIEVLSVKLHLNVSAPEAEKHSPVDFSLTLANESPLPFPFVEAVITVPSDDAVRCISQRTMLSLIPFGNYVIEKRLSFAYRGSYQIGVSELYFYDFFRLFRYRVKLGLFRELFVTPRRLQMDSEGGGEDQQEETETVVLLRGQDNTELSEIRSYQPGDSLRSVHWKLSSKTQDLMVRQYARNADRQTFLFVDTAKRYDPEDKRFLPDVNEYTTDGIIEGALALALRALRRGGYTVTLVWYDSRGEGDRLAFRLVTEEDYENIFRLFSTAPITQTAYTVANLANLLEDNFDGSSFVFVAGSLTDSLTASLCALELPMGTRCELYTFEPFEQILPSEKSAYLDASEAYRDELLRHGITVHDLRDVVLAKKEVTEDV